MNRSRRLIFDWQIGLIVLSALVGLAITYNLAAALRQFAVVLISILVYLLVANIPDRLSLGSRKRPVLGGILTALPVFITTYFLATNDWSRWVGKVPLFDPVLHLLSAWPLSSIGLDVNPNAVGGALAALIPLQVYALRHARRWVQVLLIGISFSGLVLSQTRGAWLALIIAVGMWAIWKAITVRVTNIRHARQLWLTTIIIGGLIIAAALLLTPIGERLLGFGGDRRDIWRNSVDLIGDYPFTGLGLAGFEMAYSTYALLIHVGHTTHAHNLWLDIWLNQGLLAVIALAGLTLNAAWPKPASHWRMSALIALAVILLHSLVDDPYYGYGGMALPVVFIPLGLLLRPAAEASNTPDRAHSRFQPAFVMWGLAAVALVFAIGLPTGRAAFAANLGAVQQTRAELSVYHWPEIAIQDVLRQSDSVDLTDAVQRYESALAMDSMNASANRRLGQIELARQQFAVACAHFTAAYQTAPQQRATRQLLGECAAFDDQPERAVQLWKTVNVNQSQLNIRAWWYQEYLHDDEHAAQLQTALLAFSRE